MPIAKWETKSKIHGIVNLILIFCTLSIVGSVLWFVIPHWWLWIITSPVWCFVVILIGHRLIPVITNDFIEAIFKTKWSPPIKTIPFQLKLPWKSVNDGGRLERELLNRVGSGHPLKGLQVKAMAVRIDSEEVLFYTSNSARPIAIVHLALSEKHKKDNLSPPVRMFISLDAWRKSEYQNVS